jgi:hypothetical protein
MVSGGRDRVHLGFCHGVMVSWCYGILSNESIMV